MASPARPKILIVDDDPRLRKLLARFLRGEDFDVECVVDGAEMERQMRRERYDLLLLDVMLPGDSGFTICKRLRDAGDTICVIILSAKGDDVDRIVGLRAGADDYIAKPFNPEELLARIQAVLRRRQVPAVQAAAGEAAVVSFGPFHFNLENRALTKAGALIPLSSGEFSLLKVFAEHLGQPLSREQLAEMTRGREQEEPGRSIDVQVSRLRKLLGDDPQKPRLIKTVWGFGYALVAGAARSR